MHPLFLMFSSKYNQEKYIGNKKHPHPLNVYTLTVFLLHVTDI